MQREDRSVMPLPKPGQKEKQEGVWEAVKVIFQALLIAFVVRTFLFQPFSIPSASMYPTLEVGDYVFVSKLSYGYSRYSFNFDFNLLDRFRVVCCPLTFPARHFLADRPERGDVAVFKYPPDINIDYIKRVIGLPGDRIQMKEGVLFINGDAVQRETINDYDDREGEARSSSRPGKIRQYRETLPNGVSYNVLDIDDGGLADSTEEYIVPADHYFMMGDNRDNSQDSRFLNAVGYVPIENFVGRADVIFFSVSKQARWWEIWKWPFAIRWARLLLPL